ANAVGGILCKCFASTRAATNREEKEQEMVTPTGRRVMRDFFLLAFGAFLHTLAFPPYEWAGAGWLALAPLFLVLRNQTPKAAFGSGFLYALLWCAGVGSWLYWTVSMYFPLVFPLDVLFILLNYGFFAGLSTGIIACFSSVLMRHSGSWLRWGGIPALWVSGEFIRSDLLHGFSWGVLGYSQYRHLSLIQISDITGVYGLSFLMALSSYVAAEIAASSQSAIRNPQSAIRIPWPALGFLAVGVAVTLLYGRMRLQHDTSPFVAPPVIIALVQGKAPDTQRWQRVHYAGTLLTYTAVTRRGIAHTQPDLVVWPEFAVGFYLDREPLLRTQLGRLTRQLDTPLLLGAPRMEESAAGTRYYNAAYLMSPGGQLLDVYDKMRLVPFTEYRPFALPASLHHSQESPSEFTAGRRPTVFSLPQSTFGVMICYEATFPSLARRLVRDGAQFLINMSNDTWLAGQEAAVSQHFAMAVFRAVENRRYLARAATAGISGFVDPTGRPVQLSTEEGTMLGAVIPRQEVTVYTRYGDWFAWACVGVALVALMKVRRENFLPRPASDDYTVSRA
ncbi:MAG: apolipoprotein N-acyltransferase, partial [Candidatus Binatia bacterium]